MKDKLINAFFIVVGLIMLILFVVEMNSQKSLGIFRPIGNYDRMNLENTRTLEDLKIPVEINN